MKLKINKIETDAEYENHVYTRLITATVDSGEELYIFDCEYVVPENNLVVGDVIDAEITMFGEIQVNNENPHNWKEIEFEVHSKQSTENANECIYELKSRIGTFNVEDICDMSKVDLKKQKRIRYNYYRLHIEGLYENKQ